MTDLHDIYIWTISTKASIVRMYITYNDKTPEKLHYIYIPYNNNNNNNNECNLNFLVFLSFSYFHHIREHICMYLYLASFENLKFHCLHEMVWYKITTLYGWHKIRFTV